MLVDGAQARAKRILEHIQEHDFLRDLKFQPFLRCYAARKKMAGFSNFVKNSVLECCSNIFVPLKKVNSKHHERFHSKEQIFLYDIMIGNMWLFLDRTSLYRVEKGILPVVSFFDN